MKTQSVHTTLKWIERWSCQKSNPEECRTEAIGSTLLEFCCHYTQIPPLMHISLYDLHLLTSNFLPTQVTLVAFHIWHCPGGQAESRKSRQAIQINIDSHTILPDMVVKHYKEEYNNYINCIYLQHVSGFGVCE